MIIKKNESNDIIKGYFEVPLVKVKGVMISTYNGLHSNVPVPFSGEPLPLDLNDIGINSKDIAKAFYDALAPKENGKDYRVGIAAVHYESYSSNQDITVLNREDIKL